MEKSNRTKSCQRLTILFTVLHFLCLFGPFLYFVPYSYIVGEVASKVVLSIAIIIALVLTVISIFSDVHARAGLNKTILWTLIIGVLICLTEVKTFIYVMAIISIIDELLIVRLKDKYKGAAAANKEIDRRA